MAVLVQKYGGTSVGDPDRIRAVADHVARVRRRGNDVTVVVSAMGKETDELLRLAEQVSSSQPGREMDMLITAGERKAVALMCMALVDIGVPARSFTGSQAGFLTDTNHRNAKILEITPYRIIETLEAGIVPVVAGAQGVSTDRDVTFLGRGGTDTTAVALSKALGADICELYTDVSGVFSADPRLVPSAQKMPSITFDELLEMTATGCPKPAMRSVEVAHSHGVRLHIRSAFTWERGTYVVEQGEVMEQPIVRAVTHDVSESKVTVANVPDEPGVSATLFRALATANVDVDMIVQNVSEDGRTDISFTVPTENLELASSILEGGIVSGLGAKSFSTDDSIGRVSVIGAGMKSNPGVAATMFETLAACGINIEMISTSAIRISCVVSSVEVEEAVVALHTAFGLDAE
ncbi:MAG: aspartate kinase [Actinomycetia bacterium]|nr:aspartate kinase [Actinomycetes bacterium]